jgi:hypothetical protein
VGKLAGNAWWLFYPSLKVVNIKGCERMNEKIVNLKPRDKVLLSAEVIEVITSSGLPSGTIQSIRVKIKTSGFTSTTKISKGQKPANEEWVWLHLKSLPEDAVMKKE